MMMSEKEKMLAGMLYDASDPELVTLLVKARRLARRYNQIDEDEVEIKEAILKELLPNSKNLPGMQAPVYFDYGCNTSFGKFCSTNFNFTCLDVCPVKIGDNVLFGPNVTLATPMHPLVPEERNVRQREDGSYYALEYAKPITIESNCWIAANVIVCGGVTIISVSMRRRFFAGFSMRWLLMYSFSSKRTGSSFSGWKRSPIIMTSLCSASPSVLSRKSGQIGRASCRERV